MFFNQLGESHQRSVVETADGLMAEPEATNFKGAKLFVLRWGSLRLEPLSFWPAVSFFVIGFIRIKNLLSKLFDEAFQFAN